MSEETEAKLAGAAADISQSTDAPGITDDVSLEGSELEGQLETQAAAEAADGPVDSPAVTQQRPAWIDSLGDDFKGLDESGAQSRLSQLRREAQEANQLRQQQQWFAWQHQQQAEQQRQQAAAAEQAKQAEQHKPKREVPPFDPAWVNLVRKNEQGEWVAVNGAQPDLPQKLAVYAAWKEEEQRKLLADPAAYLQETAGDRIREMATQVMREQWQAMEHQALSQREQHAQSEFQRLNAHLIYDDPDTMQRLSPIGQQVAQRGNVYLQNGIQSRAMAAQLALRDMYAEAQSLEYQRVTTTQKVAETQRDAAARQRVEFQKTAIPANGRAVPAARKPATPAVTTSTSSLAFLEKAFSDRGFKVKEDAAA